ncbi:MAG: DUF5916 domain-containing protein [Gemmatimonadetes bacterium]|nr:DUF5916 domain-containing protein [Gemmatimonadota bacterium]
MLFAAALAVLALPLPQQSSGTDAGSSQNNAPPPPPVATAVRADQAPRIDGRADDAIWLTAPKYSEFREFQPRVDAEPRFKTEFQVAYDKSNLYVFVRMYDPHPDSIMHALSRRDVRGPSDQIKLLIDSYDDKRSGYEFAVNADGVKRDYSMANDQDEDESWNGIWDVATLVDSLGWTAEYRVPLSQMRYANADSHTFGFGIWRDIERYAERTGWPLWSPLRNGISSQLGRLTGFTGLSTGRRVEATPYFVTKNVQSSLANSRLGRSQELTLGGDVKFGITPNITLDATVNPDFGQVEADPAVVNLTAFETFFSERRPFFAEGTRLYQFGLNCYIASDCRSGEGLFYSRRIGRSPALRGLYGDAGKIVEPQTNYALVRAQQDLRNGDTGFGVIATGVNRSLDAFTDPHMPSSAYAGGASFLNRFQNGNYELNGQFTASQVTGSGAAIARLQTNSVHYYQQPGDDVAVDSTSTSLTGHSEQLKFGKYAGGITRFEMSIVNTSAGFDVNDLGYLRRADMLDWSTWTALSWREAKWIYRWAQLNGNYWTRWNTSGDRVHNGTNVNGHMGLKNNWDIHLGGTISNVGNPLCDRCTRGGPLVGQSKAFYPWGGFNTDARKTVSGGFWVNLGFSDEGNSQNTSLSPFVNFRVGTRLSLNVGMNYSDNTDDSQWYGNFADAGVTHYAFARLDQKTVGMSTRFNYTATPDLTFEFYGEPFVSTGTYSNVREVSATPRASDYNARYTAYTAPAGSPTAFTFTQLRTNAVVRWEYLPGSTLFVVWAHGRENFANQNLNRPWASDYRDLLDLHPDNTFLIKMAYWLNR